MSLKHFLLPAVALPLAIAGASFAQPAPPPAPPPPADGQAHMMRMERPDPAKMAERHAQRLRDVLQLRPDQEGALKALIDATRPPADMMDHAMGAGAGDQAPMTTPQRLDRMLAHIDQARAMMVRHADAVKRFYAQLSPAQQKAFDALHAGGMGHGMGMMGHGMGMGPGMGMHRRMMIMRGGPGGGDMMFGDDDMGEGPED